MLVFLVPLMLSNILQSASATLNSIYLGRLIGVQALAAASAFFPIVFFMIAFFIGIASGATVLIGQAYGARDEERLKAVAGTTLTLCIGLGVRRRRAGLGLRAAAARPHRHAARRVRASRWRTRA